MRDLSAFVVVDEPISGLERQTRGSVVKFSRGGQDYDLSKVGAIPPISWEPTTVTAHVKATQGTETIQVALVDAQPSAPPPAGYHVVAVIISPQLVLLTGSPQSLQGITSITLSPVSLAGYTSDHTFTLKVVSPDPSITVSVKSATVTYKIAPNPAVSPSP
jgi:YbbR domain-containing protein